MKERKTARYAFRLTPETREILRDASFAAMVPLPDLMIMGALELAARCRRPGDFERIKAKRMESMLADE